MEDLKVPHKYHRFLIGKGGQNLSKLMADTGVVRILFPPTKKDSKPKESSEQPAADGAKGGKDVGKAGKGAKAAEGSAKAAEGSAAAAGNVCWEKVAWRGVYIFKILSSGIADR